MSVSSTKDDGQGLAASEVREVHFEVTDCEDPQAIIRDQMKLVEKMQKTKAR